VDRSSTGTGDEGVEPYSLLIAVPLSATTRRFEGNLCVFPEAHVKTHTAMAKAVSVGVI
jgi:hypothetical protein